MDKKRRNKKRKGRSLQRQRALDVLFEADIKGIPANSITDLLAQRTQLSTAQVPIGEYGQAIVNAYGEWADNIDSMIDAASPNWALARMTTVDRNLLRIGAAELMFLDGEIAVVATEIANLTRDFSTDAAVPFNMGVLNKIADIYAGETAGAGNTITDLSGLDTEIFVEDTLAENAEQISAASPEIPES